MEQLCPVACKILCLSKPWARYIIEHMSNEVTEVEAGLPTTGTARPNGEIILSSLPAGRYASVVHNGSYDTVDQAHQKIERWLKVDFL